MHSLSTVLMLMAATAVSALPGGGGGGSPSQCTTAQANKCCTGLSLDILNIDVLPGLCLPLLADCNNQAACCETNGVGLLNCLTIQL